MIFFTELKKLQMPYMRVFIRLGSVIQLPYKLNTRGGTSAARAQSGVAARELPSNIMRWHIIMGECYLCVCVIQTNMGVQLYGSTSPAKNKGIFVIVY